jgi:hypothetical protein
MSLSPWRFVASLCHMQKPRVSLPACWTRCRPSLESLEDRVVPALVINPTFATDITSDPNATAIENTINQAIQIYEGYLTDSITVNITFQEMSSGLGENDTYYVAETYLSYLAALEAHATSAADAVALASLPAGADNPVNGGTTLDIRAPLARALGYGDASNANIPMDSTISLNTSICNLARPDANAADFDLLAVTLHELDEALGGGSALDGSDQNASPPAMITPLDLFRYASAGVRSYSTEAPTGVANQAYFSIDGGVTDLANFNQDAGGDFGDWYSYPNGAATPPGPEVQDAFQTPGSVPNLGVELTRLDVLGFTLTTTPSVAFTSTPNINSAIVGNLSVAGTGDDGDTVSVTITDGTNTTNAATTTVSGGTWSVGSINASSLADGQVTYAVTETDAASDTTTIRQSAIKMSTGVGTPAVIPSTAILAANASTLILQGSGFSSAAAGNKVTFSGGATGKVSHATPTQLTVTNLSGLVAGSLSVTVTVGKLSSVSEQVATVEPVVTASTAKLAVNATSLVIHGFGFSSIAANNMVKLSDGATGNVTHATRTALTVTGLKSAPAGILDVTVTSNGVSSPADVQVATVPITAPKVSAGSVTQTQITLSWTAVPGATSYEVEQLKANRTWSQILTLASGTSSQAITVPSGSTNTFRVGAADVQGTAWSTPLKVTSYTVAPTVSYSSRPATQETVSWSGVADATEFEIDQQLANGTWEELAVVSGGTNHLTFILVPGTRAYRVDPIGGMDMNGTLRVTTSGVAVTQIALTWNAVAGATKYEVDLLQADGTWKKLSTLASGTSHYTYAGYPGDTYTFQVGAIDAAGTSFSTSLVVTA